MLGNCDPAVASPDSVLATAEDGLLLRPRVDARKQQYSGERHT